MGAKANLYHRLSVLLLFRKRLRLKSIDGKKKSLKYKKRFWVRGIFQERESKSEFHLLVQQLRLADHEYFFRLFRMSPSRFEKLLTWVGPYLYKSDLRRPTALPAERLCLTLSYLFGGDSQFELSARYRISPATVSRIIFETNNVLWNILSSKGYMSGPETEIDWDGIARDFEKAWNFPNCIGPFDGE